MKKSKEEESEFLKYYLANMGEIIEAFLDIHSEEFAEYVTLRFIKNKEEDQRRH